MRLEAQWIAGFVDGSGSFTVGINRHPDMKTGYQVLPQFEVVGRKRDVQVLHALKACFHCGVVRSAGPGRLAWRVRSQAELRGTIIPFFEQHPLKSRTGIDFRKFRRILMLMERDQHLTSEGIGKIRAIAATMNT